MVALPRALRNGSCTNEALQLGVSDCPGRGHVQHKQEPAARMVLNSCATLSNDRSRMHSARIMHVGKRGVSTRSTRKTAWQWTSASLGGPHQVATRQHNMERVSKFTCGCDRSNWFPSQHNGRITKHHAFAASLCTVPIELLLNHIIVPHILGARVSTVRGKCFRGQ